MSAPHEAGPLPAPAGNDTSTALEDRLQAQFSLLIALSGACALLINVGVGNPWIELVYSAIAMALGLGTWYAGRLVRPRRVLALPLVAGIAMLLAVTWFTNDGLTGSIPILFATLFIGSALILTGWIRRLAIVVVLCALFTAILLEATFPQWVSQNLGPSDVFLDRATVLLASMTICTILASHVADAHREDRDRVVRLTEATTRARVEIERRDQEIRSLRELLTICAKCHKIRDDHGQWQHLETYITAATGSRFSHGVCPDCVKALYGLDPEDIHDDA